VAASGEILGDYGEDLGIVEPDCDGPVFEALEAGIVQLNAGELMDAVIALAIPVGAPFSVAVRTDSALQSPSKCGHNPSTTVTFSATMLSLQPEVPILGGEAGPATRPSSRSSVDRGHSG
jgi:hypothetical protein